jgi:hypothetical protein
MMSFASLYPSYGLIEHKRDYPIALSPLGHKTDLVLQWPGMEHEWTTIWDAPKWPFPATRR